MKHIRLFLSLPVMLLALAVAMPACKTLDTVFNKKSSTKPETPKVKKAKKTEKALKVAPKVVKPGAKIVVPAKQKEEKQEETKKEVKEGETEVYQPPLRGSPKSRVGGGTR